MKGSNKANIPAWRSHRNWALKVAVLGGEENSGRARLDVGSPEGQTEEQRFLEGSEELP